MEAYAPPRKASLSSTDGFCAATNGAQPDSLEGIAIEEINDPGRLDTLHDPWTDLLTGNPSDTFFLTWEWGRTWWKHLGKRHVLRILTIRRGGRLIGIAPLVVVPPQPGRLLPFRTTEFIGRRPVGPDYLDLIVRRGEEAAVVGSLSEHLASSPQVVSLGQVAAGPCPAFSLAQSLEKKGWSVTSRSVGICPYIGLQGHSWDSYLASLGATHRKNVRRRLNKIHRDFDVGFFEAKTEAERRHCLREFVHLHQKRWRSRGGSNSLTAPEVTLFHDELSRLALERGWLRLFVLRLDGRPAACVYGFFYDRVFYYYQSGFDPEFARYSVGLVAMALTIREAIAEGARSYDMLHGREEYKYLWANGERGLVAYDCYPPTLRGALARRMVNTRTAMKSVLRKPPEPSQAGASFDFREVGGR
ncbi:MAG: GNAT family N-acetyltransferase [Gammaproteobacteria bacterium]